MGKETIIKANIKRLLKFTLAFQQAVNMANNPNPNVTKQGKDWLNHQNQELRKKVEEESEKENNYTFVEGGKT